MSQEHPIVVKNITKKYSISHKDRANHHTIKDAIVDTVKKPLQLVDSHYGKHREEILALDDVSFEVKKGQVMAVMGRNGSGKSTLFKILAKVTSPTSGEAVINGKVGSLLEVGVGFHPELTGRENVHFNGSILGMKKAEVYKKFDSILEFAEIDKFIDTPVKFYSSGMKVRLAFSIAIHLDTDILLLDEVMAVGDYDFRMKCFAKMEEIAAQDKTILFVSHMPAHIRRICTHGVVLRNGKLVFQGEVEDVISEYLEGIKEDRTMDEDGEDERKKETETTHPAEFIKITYATASVELRNDNVALIVKTGVKNIDGIDVSNIRLKAFLHDNDRNRIAVFSNTLKNAQELALKNNEEAEIIFNVPRIALSHGDYDFALTLQEDTGQKKKFHQLKYAAPFTVPKYNPLDMYKDGTRQVLGPVVFDFDCEIIKK